MNKMLTITRDSVTRKILERQMAHDIQYKPGSRIKHGSGRMWSVVAVEDAPAYNHDFQSESAL